MPGKIILGQKKTILQQSQRVVDLVRFIKIKLETLNLIFSATSGRKWKILVMIGIARGLPEESETHPDLNPSAVIEHIMSDNVR